MGTTATPLTAEEIVAAVDQMDEDQLDILWDAAKARHKSLREQRSRQAALSLKTDDRVQISNIRPKKLEGATGKILSKLPKRGTPVFKIELDKEFYAFDYDKVVNIPAGCLTKLEDKS